MSFDPSKEPLAINPSGTPPNWDNPPSLANLTYGLVSTLMAITTGVVALRLMSVLSKKTRLMVDDYCAVLALVFSSAYGILIMLTNKTSRHAWDTPITFIDAPWFKRNAALCLLYGPAMFFAKAAVATLYLRIFDAIHWVRWSCWTLVALMACAYGSTIPVYAIYSFPHGDEKWDLSLGAKATATDKLGIATASFNIVTDLFLLIAPLPIILKLNLSLSKKLGLSTVFLTGIVALFATVLGLYYRITLYMSKMDTHSDPTWVAAATYITVLVELYVAIMVSCVPGCVSSWRNILRDTVVVTTIRSFLSSSRETIRRSTRSGVSSRKRVSNKSASSTESQDNLHPSSNYEMKDRECGFVGITKTTNIQQTEMDNLF